MEHIEIMLAAISAGVLLLGVLTDALTRNKASKR